MIRVPSYRGHCTPVDIFSANRTDPQLISGRTVGHCLGESNARRIGQVRKSSCTDPDNGAAWDHDTIRTV